MTVADSFAEFAAGHRQDAAPGAALHGARRCLVDWCGAAVAGADAALGGRDRYADGGAGFGRVLKRRLAHLILGPTPTVSVYERGGSGGVEFVEAKYLAPGSQHQRLAESGGGHRYHAVPGSIMERRPVLHELYRFGAGALVVDDNVAVLEAVDQRGRGQEAPIETGGGRNRVVNSRRWEAFVVVVVLPQSQVPAASRGPA